MYRFPGGKETRRKVPFMTPGVHVGVLWIVKYRYTIMKSAVY